MQVIDRILGRNQEAPEIVEPEVHGHLTAGAGTTRVTRFDLALLETPPATETFQPIAHSRLIDELEKALAFRHINIIDEDYAVSNDGMRLFSLLKLNADYAGVTFAIGLRNANNKSMRLGMVAGYSVHVCSNMMLSGEFKPMLAKHSKHFDLVESLSIGIDRIQRQWEPLRKTIDAKRTLRLTEGEAQSIIYRGFMEQKFPVKLLRAVHNEFFITPSYDEFKQSTLWSLENSFTTAFKQLKPVQQFEVTAKLGKFLKPYTQST